jgi:L-asparaginase
MRKKILVIYTGGTFGMSERGGKLQVQNLSAAQLKKNLLQAVPEIQQIADCDVHIAYNIDSCQATPDHWLLLAKLIQDSQKKYSGAVILHGTDTLAYTASALHFLIPKAPFPIVLTGAQKPLTAIRSDARQNFISALEVAAHAPNPLQDRVMVFFHQNLFLGVQVQKKSAVDFDAFHTPNFPVLANVGSEILYHPNLKTILPKINRAQKKLPKEIAVRKVLHLPIDPGFFAQGFGMEFLLDCDAVLLGLYASGTAPTDSLDFVNLLDRMQEAGIQVSAYVTGQASLGNPSHYSASNRLKIAGVCVWNDLTREAAWVKLQLAV